MKLKIFISKLKHVRWTLVVALGCILSSIGFSASIYNLSYYEPSIASDIVRRDNIYRFLEIYSLSNKEAIPLLEEVANPTVVDKFTTFSGNTDTRVPVPEIWTYTKMSEDTVSVVFDSKASDVLNLYMYDFVFDLNTNKIGNVNMKYLYGGNKNED